VETFAPLPLQELQHYYAPSATNPAALVLSAFSFAWIYRPAPLTSATVASPVP